MAGTVYRDAVQTFRKNLLPVIPSGARNLSVFEAAKKRDSSLRSE
jgi:hypothetical protein